jgi:uncharacterized protein (TIGR03643 family)
LYPISKGSVVQLDRMSDFGSDGWGFESLRGHYYKFIIMTDRELDRIIEMAWEDRTTFEAIYAQFNLSEQEVINLMRTELKPNSFKLWRKRVNSGVSQKHEKKRNADISRFKCSRQKSISNNKISKR